MQNSTKILVVEDDRSLAFIYKQLLKTHGYGCDLIHDGEQALAYLDTHHPDIVLLDMHVPYISGVEILRHIKQHPHCQRTQIFIASADEELCNMWEHDVNHVFLKPFNLKKLAQAIQQADTASVLM